MNRSTSQNLKTSPYVDEMFDITADGVKGKLEGIRYPFMNLCNKFKISYQGRAK